MPNYLEADLVAQVAANSDVPMAKEFGEAALRVGAPALLTGPAPRKNAWYTYSVRLERFLDGEGPRCEGLERFVEALDGPGDVQMLSVKEPHKFWLALLEPEGRISAVTTVLKPQEQTQEEPDGRL